MAKIISIVNQKGGVGKTTSAVNLAAALAHKKQRVLVVDLDPQAHASEHLGVKDKSYSNILDVILEKQDIQNAAVKTYLENLEVLPTNLRLGKFNQQEPAGKQFMLRKALQKIDPEKYDIILIDCQPSLSLLTLNALTASDYVLLPVQAEYFALDGLSQLILTLKEVQTKLHPKLSVLGVLVTMFDLRNKLSSEVKQELENNFKKLVFNASIPRSVKLAESPSFGTSIFEYAPSSRGAVGYDFAAGEVLERLREFEN